MSNAVEVMKIKFEKLRAYIRPQHVGIVAVMGSMLAIAYTALLVSICCHLTRITRRTKRIKTYLDLRDNDEDQEERDDTDDTEKAGQGRNSLEKAAIGWNRRE